MRGRRWFLDITRSAQNGVVLLAPSGRLSVSLAPVLRAEIQRTLNTGTRNLVIDLAAVDYVSGAGLLVLDEARLRLDERQGRLILCELTDPVRLVLELAGMTRLFVVEPSRERAIAACGDDHEG